MPEAAMPQGSRLKSAKNIENQHEIGNDKETSKQQPLDEEDLTSIIQIVDDGPGSFGRKRELEVASQLEYLN